jgi:hypothetical protein
LEEPGQEKKSPKRRGRRGGRRSDGRPALADRTEEPEGRDEALGSHEEEPREQDKEPDRRRGRGRGRQRKSARADETISETKTGSETGEREEAGDAEVDSLSDWNVPSWAELIGSLYRPDR